MPTYDYRCPNGHAFELFLPMSASSEQPCPECNADCAADGASHEIVMATRQIGSGGGVIWKGGSPTPRFSGRKR